MPWNIDYINRFVETCEACETIEEASERLGIEPRSVRARLQRYQEAGLPVKALKGALKPRKEKVAARAAKAAQAATEATEPLNCHVQTVLTMSDYRRVFGDTLGNRSARIRKLILDGLAVEEAKQSKDVAEVMTSEETAQDDETGDETETALDAAPSILDLIGT